MKDTLIFNDDAERMFENGHIRTLNKIAADFGLEDINVRITNHGSHYRDNEPYIDIRITYDVVRDGDVVESSQVYDTVHSKSDRYHVQTKIEALLEHLEQRLSVSYRKLRSTNSFIKPKLKGLVTRMLYGIFRL